MGTLVIGVGTKKGSVCLGDVFCLAPEHTPVWAKLGHSIGQPGYWNNFGGEILVFSSVFHRMGDFLKSVFLVYLSLKEKRNMKDGIVNTLSCHPELSDGERIPTHFLLSSLLVPFVPSSEPPDSSPGLQCGLGITFLKHRFHHVTP